MAFSRFASAAPKAGQRLLRPTLLRPFATSSLTSSTGSGSSLYTPILGARPASLVNYPQTQLTSLPNGLRVASETSPQEDSNTATVGVWINTGSRYECERTNGVAHFLEHMAFKGTARRSRRQLEEEVENLGGHLNAYTSREQTVFYMRVLKKDVPQAMDILGDIVTNSKISEEDVNRERDTIIREARSVDGQLEEVIFDRLHQTAYRGSSLSRTILGPDRNIETITRDDIKAYVARHYTSDRMVIAGAGAVDHKQLIELAGKHFGSVPTKPASPVIFEPARFTGSDIMVRFDDMPRAHVAYAFPTAGWSDADNYPLLVIQTLLGSWEKSVHGGIHSSSALVSEVAKWELADSITAFNTQYSDTGLFGLHAVAEPQTLNNLMYTMTRALFMLSQGVDETRLNEAKNQLKLNLLSHLDGSSAACEDIGRQILTYGRRIHPVEALARIESVDSNAIRNVAHRFFYDRDHALAAIGPVWELPDYNWIRSRSYSYLF